MNKEGASIVWLDFIDAFLHVEIQIWSFDVGCVERFKKESQEHFLKAEPL
jgi:hypothetical protein